VVCEVKGNGYENDRRPDKHVKTLITRPLFRKRERERERERELL